MIDPFFHGAAMAAYAGGRAEARIRHLIVPVVLTDAASMYPSVHSLLRFHQLLIARSLHTRWCTIQANATLAAVTLDRVLDPTFWPRLGFIAEVVVEGGILPIRAQYGETNREYTLGVNRVTVTEPLWCTGPDLAASMLLTGRIPRIIRAFAVVGHGELEGLRPFLFRGHLPIDPRTQDVFQTLPGEREALKHDPLLSTTAREWLRQNTKTVMNSGSYGILAQFTRQQLGVGKAERVQVHDGSQAFAHDTGTPETAGPYCFPPVAAMITGGARLVLAILERLVSDRGGTFLFTDTDSMAIVASRRGGLLACPEGPEHLRDGRAAIRVLRHAEVREIQATINRLNPYGDAIPHLLKIEDVNFEGERQLALYGFMISAKRYCLFTIEKDGRIRIRKRSEHGLGALMDPSRPPSIEEAPDQKPDPDQGWMAAIWRYFVARALGRRPRLPTWFDRPAITRQAFTRPEDLRPFMAGQADRPYPDQLKPFNFLDAAQVADLGHPKGVDPARCRLVAPFEKDPAQWTKQEWVDLYSGTRCHIATSGLPAPDLAIVKTIGAYVDEYYRHPERKSFGPAGQPCRGDTVGLLQRRHVTPRSRIAIGKEANRLEEVEQDEVRDWDEVRETYEAPGAGHWDQETLPVLRRVSAERIAALTGIPLRTLYRIRKTGRPPSPAARSILERFVRAHRECERLEAAEASQTPRDRRPSPRAQTKAPQGRKRMGKIRR